MGSADYEREVVQMTWDRSLYPGNWEEIALSVKEDAGWHCEECGRPCRKPGEEIQDHYARLKKANQIDWIREYWSQWIDNGVAYKPTRFVLTVAHLNHKPEDCSRGNLKALCSVCHLEYDNSTSSRFRKRQIKAERTGQLNLWS